MINIQFGGKIEFTTKPAFAMQKINYCSYSMDVGRNAIVK